jgi:translation initiation factor RLI1
VFEDPYEFKIEFEKKRGKTEAVLQFVRNGIVFDEPMSEVGGGVIDVASLALRLACVLIHRPAPRRVFILDEPWSYIRGQENKRRTRTLLKILADEFDVQWIINTDIDVYRMGSVIEMEN